MDDHTLQEKCQHMLKLGQVKFAKYQDEESITTFLHPPLVCNNRLEEEHSTRWILCDGCNRNTLYNWLHDEERNLDLCVYCVLRLLKLNPNVVASKYVRLV